MPHSLQKFPITLQKFPVVVTKVPWWRYKSARSYGSLSLSLFLFVLRMTNLMCKHNFPQKYTTSNFNNLTTKESIETA